MLTYFLGIDTGTQGVRVGVCDETGVIVTQHEKKHKTSFPKAGWAEQSPAVWWDGVCTALEACMADLTPEIRANIKAGCVCSTSSTVLPVDRDGNPLTEAITWMDNRNADQVDFISATRHPVLDWCGGEVSCEWMIPKLLWYKQNCPELYARTWHMVEQLDWINFRLTGQWKTSKCNATCKWNYIESKGGFQPDFFRLIGLEDYEEKLCTDVIRIGEPVGTIRPELADRFGLPRDLLIVEGGIDAHTSIFGLNVITPGKMGVIMGTSFVHLTLSERSDIVGIWGPYDGAVIDGLWLLEGGQISSASILNWFIETFGVQGDNPYDIMMREAAAIPPGSDNLVMLDFFQGNRTPYKDERSVGVIQGLTLKHTRAHIYRAILEAVACGTRNIIDTMEAQQYRVDTITACGGVTKDPLWMQIIADVTGKPIIINETIQAGVLGCCVVAASGGRRYPDFITAADSMVRPARTIRPNPEHKQTYDRLFDEYRRLYRNLRGTAKIPACIL